MHVFFSSEIANGVTHLDSQESAHAVRVLRLSSGMRIMILDGTGGVYEAELETTSASQCTFSIISNVNTEPRLLKLHIAMAPVKMNDRTEWFLEKAVELGVERITPVICDRSERRQVNLERFEKVILAAVKQSRQPWRPVLDPAVPFKKFIADTLPGAMAYCGEGERKPLQQLIPASGTISVLIGPEGDFTPAETAAAVAKGWELAGLGDSRLRTETAAVHTCSIIRLANENPRY
jgi:16S rRNA (uracil1498-N3)-methyltransferase